MAMQINRIRLRRPSIGAAGPRPRQRGVALVYGLIAIAILLIAAAALIRAMDTASGLAGGGGFHRDLVNQTDRGIVAARDQFSSAAAGNLYNIANRTASNAAWNYSAVALPNDPNGIPLALIDDNKFAAVGVNGNDINDAASGVTIRYLIDRQCTQVNAPSLATCVPYVRTGDTKGSSRIQRAGTTNAWVYRITVRVIGPKNSMTFAQTTIGA
jgi:hypothetical protein